MLGPQLLLDALEELCSADFEKLKWYLSMDILDGCRAIPQCRLEMASRTDTVRRMIESYGEESAVDVTAEILRKMSNKDAAERLKSRYTGRKTAAPATPSSSSSSPSSSSSSPATMLAQQGSVIIAPTVAGGSSGSWNITINK